LVCPNQETITLVEWDAAMEVELEEESKEKLGKFLKK